MRELRPPPPRSGASPQARRSALLRAAEAGERRLEPSGRQVLSFAELCEEYRDQFAEEDILRYWHEECQRIVTSVDHVHERRVRHHFSDQAPQKHVQDQRAVALGSWCGVKMALKGLGLDAESLPFDWVRISMDGLLHTLRTDFADFLKYDCITEDNHYVSWSHAFFHHALTDPEDRSKYERRIARFRSLRREHPWPHTLLFVQSANATHELRGLAELYGILAERFGPDVRLLFILDHQPSELAVLFDAQPGLMLHTLSDCRCLPENYSIVEAPFVSAYFEPIRVALEWASSGKAPEEHVLLPSVNMISVTPDLLAPLPRALIRHVSLCENLAEAFCFDPQMPPEDIIESSLSGAGCTFLPFLCEMIGQHFLALLRLRLPSAPLCRRAPPLRTARAAGAAAAEGCGSGGALRARLLERLRLSVEAFLEEVRAHGAAGVRQHWASFWEREITPLAWSGEGEMPSSLASRRGGEAADLAVLLRSLGPGAAAGPPPPPGGGRRRSPEDGRAYTYEELVCVCAGSWSEPEVHAFWEAECVPVD